MTLVRSLPTPLDDPSLEQRAVNAIRVLAMDAVQRANSGHPGLPLGAADIAYVLFSRFVRFDPAAPDWPDRDRFVLSGGHGSMLQYALLHLLGYGLSLDDLRDFRQWDSHTPGHPEYGHTPGVETTTGPLGQGLAAAVGMAMAERHLAARVNRPGATLVDHRTWVLATDGDLMEGVQSEAASLAGHLGLGGLVVVYDDNRITIDGSTDLAFSEDVSGRYRAYGWHVVEVDGHDRAALAAALEEAAADGRPSLVRARTHIALGSPNKQDTAASHGSPLGEEEVAATKAVYGWPAEPAFHVPDDVREHYRELGRRHRGARTAWEAALSGADADTRRLWDALQDPTVPPADDERPAYEPGASVATRKASGAMLAWLSPRVPALWGGSADLGPSNQTLIPDEAAFSRDEPAGRNLHFGVREHAMAAAMNGMALHGGVLPYGGTFLIFADYLRPALRLGALMGQRSVYVFTHDSIFLGEDGPTHQPVAHLASLRAMPGVTVIRPSDATETVEAWELALTRPGPVALSLTRQGLPVLDRSGVEVPDPVARGAYVLRAGSDDPDAVVFATGSEVHVALEAAESITDRAVRVVAVPSWELFAEQPADYRRSVLSPGVGVRFSVEAAASFGWERFVGVDGEMVALDRFGASAPADVLAREFGFTADALAERLRSRLA